MVYFTCVDLSRLVSGSGKDFIQVDVLFESPPSVQVLPQAGLRLELDSNIFRLHRVPLAAKPAGCRVLSKITRWRHMSRSSRDDH